MSVKVDGEGQYLARNDGITPLGIANNWTLGFWVKPLVNKEHAAIFAAGDANGRNEILISTTAISQESQIHGKRPSELRVAIKDADGTTIKHYGWPNFFQTDVWTHTFLQWNGVDLEAFKNSFPTITGVAFVNATGTMTDTARDVFYGSALLGSFGTCSGILGHFGMWDSLLGGDEMGTVVSGGFASDLTVASGSYTSQGNLQHYYRPGDIPSALGQDFSGSLNLNKQRNMDASNVTPEMP